MVSALKKIYRPALQKAMIKRHPDNRRQRPKINRSAILLFAPQTPLIFMGQEFAASTPFLYFTDHPEELGKLVTAGRRNEFKGFGAFQPSG